MMFSPINSTDLSLYISSIQFKKNAAFALLLVRRIALVAPDKRNKIKYRKKTDTFFMKVPCNSLKWKLAY